MALGKLDTDLSKIKATLLRHSDDGEEDESDGFEQLPDDENAAEKSKPFPPRPLTRDQSAVKSFLSGENCLDGVSELLC